MSLLFYHVPVHAQNLKGAQVHSILGESLIVGAICHFGGISFLGESVILSAAKNLPCRVASAVILSAAKNLPCRVASAVILSAAKNLPCRVAGAVILGAAKNLPCRVASAVMRVSHAVGRQVREDDKPCEGSKPSQGWMS